MPKISYLNPYDLLKAGAVLVISISGGKDSLAMLKVLMRQYKEMGWTGDVVIFHNDLGRAEWPVTARVVQKQALEAGIPVVMVKRIREGLEFDLFDEIDLRRMNMDAKGQQDLPHWPSSSTRYCTKHQKEQPCDTWIRQAYPENATVVVAMGLRDEESTARAKKPTLWERESFAPTLNRHVYSWLPIRTLKLADVWQIIGYTMDELKAIRTATKARLEAGEDSNMLIEELLEKFKAHPAYALGNERLSCSHCVLATENDLRNGAEFHIEAYRWLTRREMETGFSFKNNLWLCSLRPDLLDADVRIWYEETVVSQEGKL